MIVSIGLPVRPAGSIRYGRTAERSSRQPSFSRRPFPMWPASSLRGVPCGWAHASTASSVPPASTRSRTPAQRTPRKPPQRPVGHGSPIGAEMGLIVGRQFARRVQPDLVAPPSKIAEPANLRRTTPRPGDAGHHHAEFRRRLSRDARKRPVPAPGVRRCSALPRPRVTTLRLPRPTAPLLPTDSDSSPRSARRASG